MFPWKSIFFSAPIAPPRCKVPFIFSAFSGLMVKFRIINFTLRLQISKLIFTNCISKLCLNVATLKMFIQTILTTTLSSLKTSSICVSRVCDIWRKVISLKGVTHFFYVFSVESAYSVQFNNLHLEVPH